MQPVGLFKFGDPVHAVKGHSQELLTHALNPRGGEYQQIDLT